MAISKRARVRIKNMSASERKSVHSAARKLYEAELMGPKRFQEIVRTCKRY